MTQATINKFNIQIVNLKREVQVLRSLVIGNIIKDKEGQYSHKFIQEIFSALKERSTRSFNGKQNFLSLFKK
ncbi:MAG: hypothetical protein US76_02285 [Parcubacteria group bacterium GW2011_GWA2_38_13b]|nr:MAG: hypothetical protein US76_02285 [Parcubacteria group bacterium GW2011_GWA2_38_13b]